MSGLPKKVARSCDNCGHQFITNKYKKARFCSPQCNGQEQTRRASARMSARFFAMVDKRGPVIVPALGHCWEWTGYRDKKGYGHVGYGRKKTTRAHRLSWFIASGKWPTPNCLHKCDNPPCIRPSHLFEGDNADNTRDMVAKGRARPCRLEKNGRARLTIQKVREIRAELRRGVQQSVLASRFGIERSTMNHLAMGRTWAQVE